MLAERDAAAQAKRAEEHSLRLARERLAEEAVECLHAIRERLFQGVLDASPIARRDTDGSITLGDGSLNLVVRIPIVSAGAFSESKWKVVVGAFIAVRQTRSALYPGRSANLWFADLHETGAFRWWEVQYMSLNRSGSALIRNGEPFGISDEAGLRDADLAASPAMHVVALAADPVPIDDEHEPRFILRWRHRLALAALNQLMIPTHLPEKLD